MKKNWPTSGKSTMYIWWDFAWKKDGKGGGEVLIASYQSLAWVAPPHTGFLSPMWHQHAEPGPAEREPSAGDSFEALSCRSERSGNPQFLAVTGQNGATNAGYSCNLGPPNGRLVVSTPCQPLPRTLQFAPMISNNRLKEQHGILKLTP